ncbi:MAG TPA: cysteine desulfurase family protein [bacterium]|nr:cysteine desulfurase family protein [bacterium]
MIEETKRPIYLDYNATTPHDPEVIAAMRPYLDTHFGNPSSSHWYGRHAQAAVEHAREQVAALLNCKPEEVVFTSGGTESNNYAIMGTAFHRREQGNHILTSQVEHPAVIEVCRFLEQNGFDVTYLPVDKFGLVDVSDVEKAITSRTILITIMHANNEVGTIQPIEEVSHLARDQEILLHTDAAQSVGKIPTDVPQLGVDLLSVAGHKLYAPKGIGALYVREGLQLTPLMHGAGQERGHRPGTENLLEIVGLGSAGEIARRDLEKNRRHLQAMRDQLDQGLREHLQDCTVNGHPEKRLPNTLSVSIPGVDADGLLARIEDRVAASAGAACHANRVDISHVLRAIGVPLDSARGTIRLSTGKMTTEREITGAVEAISAAVRRLERGV